MERSNIALFHVWIIRKHRFNPLFHLACGFVGERDGENLVGGNLQRLDRIGDLGGDHPGLPAPGPRQHQQRPAVFENRFPLRIIQLIEKEINGSHHVLR